MPLFVKSMVGPRVRSSLEVFASGYSIIGGLGFCKIYDEKVTSLFTYFPLYFFHFSWSLKLIFDFSFRLSKIVVLVWDFTYCWGLMAASQVVWVVSGEVRHWEGASLTWLSRKENLGKKISYYCLGIWIWCLNVIHWEL